METKQEWLVNPQSHETLNLKPPNDAVRKQKTIF